MRIFLMLFLGLLFGCKSRSDKGNTKESDNTGTIVSPKPLDVGTILHDRLELPVIAVHREFIQGFETDSSTYFPNLFGRDRLMGRIPLTMAIVDSIYALYTPIYKIDSLFQQSVNCDSYISYEQPLNLAYAIFRKDIIWEIIYHHSELCHAEQGNFLAVLELMDRRIMEDMYDALIATIEHKIEYINQKIAVDDPNHAYLYIRDDKTLLRDCQNLLQNVEYNQRQWLMQIEEDQKLYRSSTIFNNGNWPITMYSRYSPYIVRATFLLDILQGINDQATGQAYP